MTTNVLLSETVPKQQKSIFCCTKHQNYNQITINSSKYEIFKSKSSPGILMSFDPKHAKKKETNGLVQPRECSTQTSKTILQLASYDRSKNDFEHNFSFKNMPVSDVIMPTTCEYYNDSLKQKPHQQINRSRTLMFFTKNGNYMQKYNLNQMKTGVCEEKVPTTKSYESSSHSSRGSQMRMLFRQNSEIKIKNKSNYYNSDNMHSYNQIETPTCQGFMSATAASQIKSRLFEVQNIKRLFHPLCRGKSSSPSNSYEIYNQNKKIPYIDSSEIQLKSSRSLVDVGRNPKKVRNFKQNEGGTIKTKPCFDEDLFQISELNVKLSLESVMGNEVLESSTDRVISISIMKLRSSDWTVSLHGLAEIIEISKITDILPYMSIIYQKVIDLLKSPRSHVCRTACQACGHLFESVRDTRKPEFDDIVALLLHKTADANKFIRHDANLSLDCMVTHISKCQAIRVLCDRGSQHKNPLVRNATARLLICTIVLAGPSEILNVNEQIRKKIFVHMGIFFEDKNIDVRKFAERLAKILYKEPGFDANLKRYLRKDQIVKIKKTLKPAQRMSEM